MKFVNTALLSATTGAGTVTSSAVDASLWQSVSVQAQATSTFAGTFAIQASNDPAGTTPTNWDDVASSSATINSSTSYLKTFSNQPYQWLRVRITSGSGSGTASARLFAFGYK